ncbi:MAG: hypothetical protein IH624_00825 [Phycisphaerae bacterium]|nr:hypothetical protein [Phycisphaerae bacterium]
MKTQIACRNMSNVIILACAACLVAGARAETVVEWDFTSGTHGWSGNGQVEPVRSTPEGLLVVATGTDPWIEGPAVDYPADTLIRITVAMKSAADRAGEFFYGRTFTAAAATRFTVNNDDLFHAYTVYANSPFGPRTRLRLDPSHNPGRIVVRSIKVESLRRPAAPPLAKPSPVDAAVPAAAAVRSGELALEHSGAGYGDFVIRVSGQVMAQGYHEPLIGYFEDPDFRWLNLKDAKVTVARHRNSRISESAVIKDPGGAAWTIVRTYAPDQRNSALHVETAVSVDQDREVVRLPWLTLFAGKPGLGGKKNQALFSGVEYLADEPSSSDADIAKPNNIRSTPDPIKITIPMMAIQQDGRYLGLVWQRSDRVAATFDSPDRIYKSGRHLMELSAPAVGGLRFENDYVAYAPFRLKANEAIRTTVTIIGGRGDSIVPAVKDYLALRPLPALPEVQGGFPGAVDLLAHGWLDSQINEGGLFRHAVWGESFRAQPAADAAVYMNWLARNTQNDALRKRLLDEQDKALSKLHAGDTFGSGVSHVRPPKGPLVFGRVAEYVAQRLRQARAQLARFDDKGLIYYKAGEKDYGRTHYENHANGLHARTVVDILEAATLSGDKELARDAVALLDKQTVQYRNTVPRGAQTWEMPLHTPDILASAYMVKAYVLGSLLTDRADLLDEARYWAWTGVPFIYLDNPTEHEVGPYATIAVLGATNWVAPNWFGQPVQWCGLVYASALYDLAEIDRDGPWLTIAKGITLSGLQMTWPTSDKDRQGLLPDFFHLRDQISDGPAINPGTVGAHVPEAFNKGKLYDVKKLPQRKWFIHAPGAITGFREDARQVLLTVQTVPGGHILISGLDKKPAHIEIETPLGINAVPVEDIAFFENDRCLSIKLPGPGTVSIR